MAEDQPDSGSEVTEPAESPKLEPYDGGPPVVLGEAGTGQANTKDDMGIGSVESARVAAEHCAPELPAAADRDSGEALFCRALIARARGELPAGDYTEEEVRQALASDQTEAAPDGD